MKKFEGLNPLYKSIRRGIMDLAVVENVDWFNGYEAVQLHEVGCFVEFPDEINFEEISKSDTRADLRVRVHIYTKVLRDVDGYIPQAEGEAHDTLALLVRDQLRNKALAVADGDFYALNFDEDDFYVFDETPEQLCKRLRFAGWRHWHYYKGYMITWVDYMTKVEG